jgi:hypothetical protein
MRQEWFTLAELRAADVGLNEPFIRGLAQNFEQFKPHKARTRIVPGQHLHELDAEFHISVLPRYTQHIFQNPAAGRIAKLGICRPVDDQAVAA